MDNLFESLFAAGKGAPSGKNAALLRALAVISSSILSSSVIAAGVKAWLQSRRTRLTIQMNNGHKTLTYEGTNLSKDAPVLQAMMEQLHEQPATRPAHRTVTISPAEEEARPPLALEADSQQPTDLAPLQSRQPTLWQRLGTWITTRWTLLQRHR